MDTKVRITRQLPAQGVSEGAGVTVWRSIGTPYLRNLDPFLMLDYFGSDDPNQYIAGFPNHPHRGFCTFTYMLDGHMLHEDSMGNKGDLTAGAAQWMKAGSGVIHSEMPKQESGLMRGFQLWINLPATEKMSDPEYQEFAPEKIPEIEMEGARVKVLVGEYLGIEAPISDCATSTRYLYFSLDAQAELAISIPQDCVSFLFLFEGSISVADTTVSNKTLLLLSEGKSLEITAGNEGARFILVSGKPIGEEVVQYGPFVMNTEHEIRQAMEDYNSGRLVKVKAGVIA